MRPCIYAVVCLAASAAAAVPLRAQGVITTVAGTDWIFPRGEVAGLDAPVGLPTGLRFDESTGRLLLLDYLNHVAFQINGAGRLTPLAGNGLGGFSGDEGAAVNASLLYPRAFTLDGAGNLYIADSEGRGLRLVTPDGGIRSLAGTGKRAPADGVPLAEAQFSSIISLAVLPDGRLVLADDVLGRLFVASANGILTRVAGNGVCRSDGDGGEARAANLCLPDHLAADAQGNLYFSDVVDPLAAPRTRRIRRIDPEGRISAYAGNGLTGRVRGGGSAVDSPMQPYALAIDPRDGSLLIASGIAATQPDEEVTDIARVTADGRIETIPAPAVARLLLTELAAAPDGAIYVTASLPGRVFRIRPGEDAELIAGNGRFRFAGDGGPGTLALLNLPLGLALDQASNQLFIADVGNNRVRRLDANGVMSTVAGNGVRLLSPPEPGSAATENPLLQPFMMTMDAEGRPYFSSSFGLHRLNPDGTQTVEPYLAANPGGLAFDAAGSLLYADRGRGRLLRGRPNANSLFTLDAIIPGSTREGGLNAPFDVATDGAGNVYVSEWQNHRVLRIDSGGAVTTFAGSGKLSTAAIPAGARPATSIALTQPSGLAVDAAGNLLIRSYGHVSRVTPDGELEVLAGIGPSTLGSVVFGDGGLATESALGATGDIAVDAAGNIYLSEVDNNRVRKILAAPPAFQVSAETLELTAISGGAPSAPRALFASAEIGGLGFQVAARTSDGGEWLRVSAPEGVTPRAIQVNADPAALEPGVYTGTLDFTIPHGRPQSLSVNVRLVVALPEPAGLTVDKAALTFTYPKTAARREQTLLISNPGSGAVLVEAATPAPGFIDITPAAGTVRPGQPLAVVIGANPEGRGPGLYRSVVTIRGAGVTRQVPVTMTVSDGEQAILLSQTGLSFQTVAGGGIAPPQSFGVLNLGNGAMSWRVSTSTLSGGPGWLSVGTAAGVTEGGAGGALTPTVDVRIDQAGLEPGVYHGLVQVESDTAVNSPHVLPVFLEVLPPEARPGSVVQPAALTFTGVEGEPIGSQELTVFNLAGDPIAYRSSATQFAPRQPLQYAPIDSEVTPGAPQRIVVQPQTRLLKAGAYRSDLSLQFADGTVRRVEVNVVIRPVGAVAKSIARAADSGCTPQRLIPALKSLGQAASVPAGWPAGVVVEVSDDCGRKLDEGSVVLSFSNGDPPLVLQALRGGRWQGTWVTRENQPGTVTVRVAAETPQADLKGEQLASADLRAAEQPPAFEEEGVVNAPLAPGGPITLTGLRFTVNQSLRAPGDGTPLPDRLGETEVLIAGKRAPLFSASEDRIEALVPMTVNPNTRQQLLVRRGTSYSRAVPVNVASVQPAVAFARIIREGGEPFLNTPETPARAGDRVVLSCTGLGVVDEAGFAAGTPAAAAVRTVAPVVVRVGGQAIAETEASLTPGEIGRYQVSFTLPEGVTSGERVDLVLESQGQTSSGVSLAIR